MATELSRFERRVYTAVWLLGFTAWLGFGAAMVVTGSPSPWVWPSAIGGVVAVVFGTAVRYQVRLLPFRVR